MKDFKTLQDMFADPKRWTKGAAARYETGTCADGISNVGVASVCLLGGLHHVYHEDGKKLEEVREKLQEAIGELFPERSPAITAFPKTRQRLIHPFNDHSLTTITDVQKVCALANV